MSINAHIDQNDVKTWILLNEITGETETLYVDPVTDAVLVYNVANRSSTPIASRSNAQRDGNDYPTQLGYDETTRKSECLRSDTSGNLIVILE